MRILFDCRQEVMYPLAKAGFAGGSQTYARAIIGGMAARGHAVHVIANDLTVDEQRGPNEWWWPPSYFPRQFDVAVMQMHARPEPEYEAPICILMTSCVDPWLGPEHDWADAFDGIPVFSETHKKLLCEMRPVKPERVYVTGLGVDFEEYLLRNTVDPTHPQIQREMAEGVRKVTNVPGRMFYANDPARGLFYVLDVFDLVRQRVPHATLHVAYDFDTQLSWRAWEHSQMAQMLHDCKRRLAETPGMVNVGALDREGVIREQLECQVHCMPSDPPGKGTQTHGLTQMECAAAGAALVLSDVEAFPEVFAEGATILPVIGKYLPQAERRVSAADYAEVVVELMTDERKWAQASHAARALAQQHTWETVLDRWEQMLAKLREGAKVG